MDLATLLADWPVTNAAAVICRGSELTPVGDVTMRFPLASVTKLATAMAALVAHEEGTLDLDDTLTDAGATTADLLAHTGGISPDTTVQMSAPRTRRIYSTAAYELVADGIAARADMPFAEYLHEAVFAPLDMTATTLDGSPGAGATSTALDVMALMRAWQAAALVDGRTLERATTAHLPELSGVLPGFGRQDPNPWGLGPEIRGHKHPHWTGEANSASTYGHFGQSGTMAWIDPVADCVVVALADRPFDPWAARVWPQLSDAVLATG